MNMTFTYDAYCALIDLLKHHGYPIVGYKEALECPRCAILRHDVDTSLEKAAEMAVIEGDMGVKASYFILLTTDFYNAASARSQKAIDRILAAGHEVGLHLDETLYKGYTQEQMISAVLREKNILSDICKQEITTISLHRPSVGMLNSDFHIPGMLNVYGNTFFRQFKYVSDSRRNWREPVVDVINSGAYDRLHILTHPFWYHSQEKGLGDTVRDFVNSANRERYDSFRQNITDLGSIMRESEVR